jgi:hypothetical protein
MFEFEDVPIGPLAKLRLTLAGHGAPANAAWFVESVVVTTLVEGDSGRGWEQESVAYFWGHRCAGCGWCCSCLQVGAGTGAALALYVEVDCSVICCRSSRP